MQEILFAQYGKIILKPLKKRFLWFNQVAVFIVISWNHYTETFMNFGTKRAYSNEDYSILFFLYEPVKLDPRLFVLKIFMIIRVYFS